MSFDEDPADNRTELDLRIEEVKSLQRQLAEARAEIERLNKVVCSDGGTIQLLNKEIEKIKRQITALTGRSI